MIRTDRFSLPKDAWYVGTASVRLGTSPLAVTIHGEQIVLFRDGDDAAFAIHDRCPHRGVALSLGRVEDGTLACPYHGWRFNGRGGCQHIPSLRPDQRIKDVSVRSYPVVEQDGHVWIWMGSGEPKRGPDPIEDFAAFAWLQGAIDMDCEAILPIENNLDVCHAAFTHPNQHPQWFRVQAAGLMVNEYKIETTSRAILVTGPGTRLHYTFPDRITVGGNAGFRLVLHHVPTTPGRCRQHWLLQRSPVQTPVAPTWSDNEPEILAQDRRILETAQRAYDTEGGRFEQSAEADAPGLAVRRLLVAYRDGKTASTNSRQISILS